jgi:NitT/TauT family transport system ATP-binding protein
MIALEGVAKTYRTGVAALAPVDLAVGEREFVALLGPSGCGKSTLLRIVAGLVSPSAGRRELAIASRPGEIGFVFQEPTLMPWASVADNIYLPLRLAGMTRRQAAPRIEEAIEAVGLAGFAGAYPRELSGGMRMRVSIARAFVTRPRLLLLDEPFAALDEITRFRLNDDLLRLWGAERWTVLFVTHSVFEAAYLAGRVVVMTPRPGRIAADLRVALSHPRTPELRGAPEFGAACAEISHCLSSAMREGAMTEGATP